MTVADIYYLLDEARVQLAEAHEKERVATEHALELNSRLTAVESQLVTYRQEKSRLEATLEVERAKLDTDRKSTRLNSSHPSRSRMPSSA